MSYPQYPSDPQQPPGQSPHGPPQGEPPYNAPPGEPSFGPPVGDHQYNPQGEGQYGPQGGPPYGPGEPPYGSPPGQPPKGGMSTGGKIALGCGGVLAVAIIIVLLVAIVSTVIGGDGTDAPTATPPTPQEEVEPAEEAETEGAEENQGVVMTATNAGTTGDVLDDTVYTVVDIEIVNNSDEPLDVNPIYFSMELSDGSTVNDWGDTLFADIEQVPAETLMPGDSTSGQLAVVGEVEVVQVELGDLVGLMEPIVAVVE